jgi:hypothetical protein
MYKLGTDVAAFMFFHPGRLEHRKDDPIDWWDSDFRSDFVAGRFVAFCTSSDGQFTMKFVRRELTPVENQALVARQSFRYHVQDGRLYWDNANNLPSEDRVSDAEDDPEGWLTVPNGRYRLTVHALDWFSIPDADREAAGDITHYIVRFERVETFRGIAIPDKLPWLVPSKRWYDRRKSRRPAGS